MALGLLGFSLKLGVPHGVLPKWTNEVLGAASLLFVGVFFLGLGVTSFLGQLDEKQRPLKAGLSCAVLWLQLFGVATLFAVVLLFFDEWKIGGISVLAWIGYGLGALLVGLLIYDDARDKWNAANAWLARRRKSSGGDATPPTA